MLENKTGRVLAMTGGFSYPLSQLNRATQAVRQPGSAIKPLSYLAALGKGLQPNTLTGLSPYVAGKTGTTDERSGGLEVDDQLDFRGLLHRQVGRFLALENRAGGDAEPMVYAGKTSSVAHQAPGRGGLAILIDSRHGMANGQCCKPLQGFRCLKIDDELKLGPARR